MRTAARAALALGLATFAAILPPQAANASHPRPSAASSVRVSLVPAYNQCTATNRTHGPPLGSPSCSPPVQSSASVTVGTTDANGAAASSVGTLRVTTLAGAPGPPEDSDARFVASITDVRCKAATTACGSSNAAGGADYTGQLQAGAIIRVTDHFNGTSAAGGSDPATVVDLPLPVNMACTATGSTGIGGSCTVNTTFDAVIPNDMVLDGKRAVVAIQQLLVRDGGPDGVMNTSPNTLFAVQGLFAP
jgi:hypothetical protein